MSKSTLKNFRQSLMSEKQLNNFLESLGVEELDDAACVAVNGGSNEFGPVTGYPNPQNPPFGYYFPVKNSPRLP